MSLVYNYYGTVDAFNSLYTEQNPTMDTVLYPHSIQSFPIQNRNNTFTWSLRGGWRWFDTIVGQQDGGCDGTNPYGALFQIFVYLDGVLAFMSSQMYQGTVPVSLNVTDVQVMQWIVDPLGSQYCDNVFWGTPLLYGPKCFGIWGDSNYSTVCSGNGQCIGPDICACNPNYFGTQVRS